MRVGRHTMRALCALLVLMAAIPAGAAVINVPADQPTIQEAIDAAVNGDEVVIAQATYHERITFSGKAITVRSTNPADPAVVAATIIDGDAAGEPVVIFANGEGAASVLTGLTITNGSASLGGGIYCDSASPTISTNIISGNSATSNGGGIYCSSSPASISGNIISGNSAIYGGGIYSSGGSLTVSGNTISGNAASSGGGGIYRQGAEAWTIRDCIITFATSGRGIYMNSAGTDPTISYCNVSGNTGGNYYQMTDPTGSNGCISADPLFADAAGGDFHLRSPYGRWSPGAGTWLFGLDSQFSPCIDAGSPASAYVNEPGPNGGRVNMGAYGNTAQASRSPGNQPPTAPDTVAIGPASPTATDDLTAEVTGGSDPDGEPVSYQCQWQGPSSVWLTTYGATLPASVTAKNDQWRARARAHDGISYGPWTVSDPITIADTPPTAPAKVEVTPQFPKTDATLSATASGGADADDEAITYAYEWRTYSDGAWSDWTDTAPAPGEPEKDEQWQARAKSAAGGAESGWVESSPVEVGNTSPTVPTSVVITPGAPQTSDNLIAMAEGSTDSDTADTMRYEYQWAKKPSGGGWGVWSNGGGIVPASATARGDEWKVRARATDIAAPVTVAATARSAVRHVSNWGESDPVTVGDTPPTPPTLVQVRPPGAKSGATLTGYATGGSDVDGDTVEYLFQWCRSADAGATWQAWGYAAKVLSATTAKGHLWKTRARSRAAGVTSAWVESAPLTVGDSPPGPPTAVTITPASPTTNHDLRATAGGAVDPDSDPITRYLYQWNQSTDNGATWSGWVYNGRILPKALTNPGDKWKARAKAQAGTPTRSSTWEESAAVTIGAGAGTPTLATVTASTVTSHGFTRIMLHLSTAATVQVRILNLAGREVAVLPEQSLNAGTRTLLWNGKSTSGTTAPPGQYLISIEARQDGGGQSRVMVPLRK